MKMILVAMALAFAAPALAQTPPATSANNPHEKHEGHPQGSGPKGHADHDMKMDCCADKNNNGRKDCCEEGGCCDKKERPAASPQPK